MIEFVLILVFYTIPALYIILKAKMNNADDVAYIAATIPLLNIVMAVYVLWYSLKHKK